MKQKFSNIVSLGSFCSVAMELEKKGLRGASYPFDWLISDSFECVISEIENGFGDFLNLEFLKREHRPDVCGNTKTRMHFYHDFNVSSSIEEQIPVLQEKYSRRIQRFYSDISQPTLFVRYCIFPEDEQYVMQNRQKIIQILQSFNPANRILYVMSTDKSNSLTKQDDGWIALMKQPQNDYIKNWIDTVPGLSGLLYSVSSYSAFRILKNIFICYKKKILRKLHASHT